MNYIFQHIIPSMLPDSNGNGTSKEKNTIFDIAMTVDMEEWHHGLKVPPGRSQVVEDTVWLLEAFIQEDVHATFFVLGEVAKEHPRLIRRISETGHEIAFHGAKHLFLSEITPKQFSRDLKEWLPRLEDITGKRVVGFRAPFFSVVPKTRWALDILVEHGIAYDSSIYPGPNDRYGWLGIPKHPVRFDGSQLVIFPVPLLHPRLPIAFSGGAYLRILPWFVVKWGFAYQRTKKKVGMIYVHPWEVTKFLPKPVRASLRASITRYPGRKRMRKRLEALIAAECPRMGTVKDVIDGMSEIPEWSP